jgi:hypothetical protein
MALISINGVALPTPSEFQVGIMDISKAERNANGNMIIERITTKRKLTIQYTYLSSTDASTVLNSIAPTYYNVTYLDPQTKSMKTGSFYCGDRTLGMIDYINGVPRYRDINFSLIER